MSVEQRDLAVFLDRHTMRYERRYPHPIDLVWEAVSTAEHLETWMLPITKVERRLGGRCSFTWGGPEEEGMQIGEVTVFEPPRSIVYSFAEPPSSMHFDLTSDGDGTVLHFTLDWRVIPGQPNGPEDYPGGDLPGGPDTPWRPGFLAGFHEMLDDLGAFLEGTWTAADRAAQLANFPEQNHLALIDRYREYVRAQCPPA